MEDYNLRIQMTDPQREAIGFHVCDENRDLRWDYAGDRESASGNDSFGWYEERAAVASIDSINSVIDALSSQDNIDIDLLQYAVRLEFPESAVFARELLRHFLDNKRREKFGHTIRFRIVDLLQADAKACKRIYNAIMTRIKGSPRLNRVLSYLIDKSQYSKLDVWHQQILQHDVLPKSLHDPIILRQSEYATLHWHLALGTFWVDWEALPLHRTPFNDLGTSRDPNRYVWVGGAKEAWRWHSQTDRADKEVQEAGARLAKSGRGKYFRVVAEPCLMDIVTGFPIPKSVSSKPPLTLPYAK